MMNNCSSPWIPNVLGFLHKMAVQRVFDDFKRETFFIFIICVQVKDELVDAYHGNIIVQGLVLQWNYM